MDTQLTSNPSDRTLGPLRIPTGLQRQPSRTLTQLIGILPRTRHDSDPFQSSLPSLKPGAIHSYDVPAGLVSSFPVTTRGGDWCIVKDLPISAFARHYIQSSMAELVSEAEAVKELGFVR